MPFHLLTVAVICVVWCVCLLLELYLKPGKQHSRADSFRLTAICSGSGALIGFLSWLLYRNWGGIALFSLIACLVLATLVIRLLYRHKQTPRHSKTKQVP